MSVEQSARKWAVLRDSALRPNRNPKLLEAVGRPMLPQTMAEEDLRRLATYAMSADAYMFARFLRALIRERFPMPRTPYPPIGSKRKKVEAKE
jgi:hypothetical protein